MRPGLAIAEVQVGSRREKELHFAAELGYLDIVGILAEAGGFPNTGDIMSKSLYILLRTTVTRMSRLA